MPEASADTPASDDIGEGKPFGSETLAVVGGAVVCSGLGLVIGSLLTTGVTVCFGAVFALDDTGADDEPLGGGEEVCPVDACFWKKPKRVF